MADTPLIQFDTAAARADGVSDADIATFLAGRAGFDLAAARKDGISDAAIVDFLAPEGTPEAPSKPKKATIGDDINRAWQGAVSQFHMLGADASAQRLSDIEAAKRKADAGEYLTPWEKKTVANYDQAKAEAVSSLSDRLSRATQRQEKAAALPISPGYKAFKEAEGFDAKIDALWAAPGEVVTSLFVEGTTGSIPMLAAGVVGGVGPAAVVGGGQAYMQAYAGKIMELLGKRGIDLKDRDAVMAALSDPETARDIRTDASLSAIPQAAVAAVAAPVAARTLAPASMASTPVRQQAVNIPAQAVTQGALGAAGEAGSQAIIGEELEPGKIFEAGLGEAVGAPGDVAAFAAHRVAQRARTPEAAAKPVLDAPSVDDAIAAAREVVDQGELEQTAAQAAEFGNRGEQDQAAINRLFGGLNDGEVQRAADGAYFYVRPDGQELQLRTWDGKQREDTIPSALADAQRRHYEQQGVRVIYFENDAAVPFDGAVDPQQPNTIFLSNKPDRNAAQVGAHEIAHIFESAALPDGTNLGDLLQQQVAAGITAEGRAYAERLFGQTAPKREAFSEGPDGDSLHADAVTGHLIRELGADIGGEAPKFQTFLPRVIDAVEGRYGAETAKSVMQKLITGIRQAMTTLRQFFFRADEGAEYGQPPTESQAWVSNLDQIHGTLAQMYAQRFGEQAGLTDTPPRPQRLLPAPALITPPPVTAENVFQPTPYGAAPGSAPIPPTAQERAAAATVRPPEHLRLPAPALVTPPPRPVITPENVFQPETYGQPRGTEPQLQREQRVVQAMAEHRQAKEQAADIGQQVGEARATTNVEPTDGQKEAGNYQKGRVSFHGLPFVMENPKDSTRSGVDADGKRWEAKLPADYGYLSRTEGADGDQVDAYVGPHASSQRVWVVDQIDPKTGRFDEHKVMLGTRSVTEARAIYHRAFSDGTGPQRIGAITEMSLAEFKTWLKDGDTTSPVGPVQKERTKLAETKGGKRPDEQGLRDVAQRMVNAENNMIETIMERGGLDRAQAAEAFNTLQSAKGLKLDAVGGRYTVKHGRMMERDFLRKAAGVDPVRPPEAAPQPDHRMADEVDRMLAGVGKKLSAADVQRAADRVYEGTLAEGKYTRDQLYDAMELGVNRFIQKRPDLFDPTVNDAPRAAAIAKDLADLKDRLPTQTVRAGEKDAYQQFSTPPDYAYAANWVARLGPNDHVLEPSAGVGGLAVHAMNAGVREISVNELSDKRRGMIAALGPTRITGEDAAQLHNILPGDVRPTVVVMNPPFSSAAERMGGKMVLDEGAKHIEQALARLEPGGRLVAIVGDGMKPAGTEAVGTGRRGGTGAAFRDWWNRIGAEYDVRANVGVDREIYSKYGTSFPTRFLVIDKNPPSGRPMVTGQVRDAAGLIERLQEVRNERLSAEPSSAGVAAGGERPAGPQRELSGAAGGVGPGEGRRGGAAPAVAESAGAQRRRPADRDAAGARPTGGEPVVRAEPQPAARGAGGEPAAPAGRGDERGGSGSGRGGDGLRPDGSGERERPGVSEAPEDVVVTEAAVSEPDNREISEAIYEPYRPQRVKVAGAKAHPGALVQSAAMASVMPPKTDYRPKLPQSLVKSGGLSDAQLEAITYAGHAHSDVMPDGRRRGFFIGDGTGVGKGREIAGILLDNKQQGRTKAVWISEKRQLINDAKRDWNGLGQPATEIMDHGKVKASEAIKADKGILFTSYDTLKSAEQTKTEAGKVKGRSRVDQIVEWVGPDFDGVIAFDEAHNLGNATDEKGGRGVKKAAQKALAGVELQQRLPNARVVYVSATGATEVSNLAYADRLGLWGEGTPFANRQDFMGKVSDGGMAAMELVARDMKALGHYIARNLSYDGVEYARVEHRLTADQRGTYDKLAEGWQTVLQNFEKALELTGATEDGKAQAGSRAKAAAMSAFWGAHQRFFNQIITSMQMPSVLRAVEKDLKAGRQAVLQLVNTMEAAQGRALEKARDKGDDLDNLDMTPRDQLMQLIEKSFPVQQMERYIDDNGNERTRPVVDSAGNPVENKQAVAMRERLLDEIGSIRVPDGPLEILLNHFGTDKVAEVTGRGERVVRKPDESGQMKSVVEKRGAQSNVAESNDFQAGKKPILVFSEAGGTGRSYHAAIGSGSENARRSHYLVQGGWRADKAVQGFGRTHRTSQASAPIFNLVTTDLQGQKRFISSIARRLGQLGALTKGERRTGDQGLFGNRDNLESTEARDALRQFFDDVARGQVQGVDMRTLEQGMGLKMRDPDTGQLAKELPDMPQFLNRVLSLKIDDQNLVFDAFSERLDDVIARAAASGTLDVGVETYKADKIGKVSEQTVYTDPRSGAETRHVHLSVQNRNHPIGFDATMAGENKTGGRKPEYFVQNEQSGNVFAVTPAGTKTLENGTVADQVRLTSPLDYQFLEASRLVTGNWKRLTPEQARPLWNEKVASTPEFRRSDLHVITGAVLPIWDRLGGNPKIYRLQTEDGERMLARVVPSLLVDSTLQRLGAEGVKITESPAGIADRILKGATATLANEWKIKSSRVSGENRLELIGPNYQHRDELSRQGVFSERINYETRYFIPTGGRAAAAIEAITKNRPVTSLVDREGPVFSPRIMGENPDRKYTPEQRQAFERVGRATEPETLRGKIDEARADIGRKVLASTVDAYAGLRRSDPEGYMAARLANSVAGAQEVFRLYGTLKFDGSTYNYKELNGGVRAFVRSLGAEAHDFLWWVAANRAERLKAEDRENLFSKQDIRALKDLNRGELDFDYQMPNGTVTRRREAAYMDALRRYDALNKSVLDLVKESGLVEDRVVDQLWADPFYVPFYREAVDRNTTRFAVPTSGMVKQYASKKLKGGSEKLRQDLWENAFGNWDHMIDAALRNRAAVQVLENATRMGAAEEIPAPIYENKLTNAEKVQTTWAMVDGKKTYWRVEDPMTFKAVSALENAGTPGPIQNVARWFSRALRYGVTANPLFAVRNLIRDTQNSIAVSEVSANPFKNLADGFAQMDTGSRLKNLARAMAGKETETVGLEPSAISAMAGGGLMRLGTLEDAGIPKTDLRNILDTPGKLRAFGRYVADVAGAYKDALAAGEDVNRLALYQQLREQGASHDFASFQARDLMDFTLRGASPFVKTITDITPFLNARMQGLYKLGRSAADADKSVAVAVGGRVGRGIAMRTAIVLGAMTVAGLALDAIYHDDPDYQKRTEFDRQTYYWFKIGDAEFRIPKGFELAALSSMATDGIEAFFSKEMTGERWVNNFWTALGTNLQVQAPAMIQPILDVATNTRGTGGPIETMGMERLAPEARYRDSTTLIARGLSSAINAGLRAVAPRADGPSPVQIDYLVGAYGAWLATQVVGMADTIVRAASNEPERPDSDFWAKATQGLVRTDPAPQSRYVDMLYSQGKHIEQAYNTYRELVKRGRTEEARDYLDDNRDLIAKNKLFQRVIRTESQLNEQIRNITNSPTLTGEQKRVRIMALTEQKNRAARMLFAPEAVQ